MHPVLPTGYGRVLIVARYEDRPRKFPLPVCGKTVVRWATRGFGQVGPGRRSQVRKACRSGVAGCTGYVTVPGLAQCGWPDNGAPAFGNRRPPGLPRTGTSQDLPGPVQDGAAKIRILSRRRGRQRITAWMGDPIPHRTLCANVGSGIGHACVYQTRLRRRGKGTERNRASLRSSTTTHQKSDEPGASAHQSPA